MSRLNCIPVAALLIIGATMTWSGTPYTTEVPCPVGRETVEVTRTYSCSSGNDYVMSLRQRSSCDFITRLPVCTGSGIPLYAEFTSEDKETLRELVKVAPYLRDATASRYLTAYRLDQDLQKLSAKDRYWLLVEGYRHSRATFGNATYFDAFREATNAYIPDAPQDEQAYMLAHAAFVQAHMGKASGARKSLSQSRARGADDIPFLKHYLRLVEKCIDQPRTKACAPNSPVHFTP